MKEHSRNTFVVVAVLVAVLGLVSARFSVGQQPKPAQPKYEYLTQPVQVGSLQAKLSELGNDGWQVVSLIRSISAIDNSDDGHPKLKTEEYQLTTIRPAH